MIQDQKQLEEQAELLKLIAHPVRLCIVRGLWQHGCCNVMHMQGCLELPQPTISQHLAKLRQAGIIEGKRHGLEICYSLKDDRVKAILQCLFPERKPGTKGEEAW
ncbi:ArsR/SmtB family transcription factor [Acidaminococcus timonensis]|jgi:predicted transcriptional regulator|uniref:ArsR/SmtB family transcription factor n=1 Tax=Acidaminococcus TaxID=904 RepID=UPI0026E92A75|nr:metalloregulator ArsR/SmtB family transcription factor [Acidaminococcus timonensis]